MFIAKFGVKQTPIDIGEYIVSCPSCESSNWADVMVISNYYHFYYVPIFPIDKEANVICKKCGYKRYGASFSSKLFGSYNEVKHLYRHPWFTYIGLGIMTLFALLIIIFAIF